MLERVGNNNLSRLLDYYINIGWISTSVADSLLMLAENEKHRYEGSTWTLSPEEHSICMLFIEKLMGKKVDIFSVPKPGKARLEPEKREKKPTEGYLEAHLREKGNLEFAINRHEVTIKNLEQELEKKDVEIQRLKEATVELEKSLKEYQNEINKNRVYKEILEENIKLRKI